MSNLGGYQVLTKIAKKVGGPKNLVILTLAGGYVGLRSIEALAKKGYKIIKGDNDSDKYTYNDIVFQVNEEIEEADNSILKPLDFYRVLETDNDSILIEIIDNNDNPYFVSETFLKNNSNYMNSNEIELMEDKSNG